jgi:UDP-N-acetylmuramyl tripeptide synthase
MELPRVLEYPTKAEHRNAGESNSERARTVESDRSGAGDERTDSNSPTDKCRSKAIGRYHRCNTRAALAMPMSVGSSIRRASEKGRNKNRNRGPGGG